MTGTGKQTMNTRKLATIAILAAIASVLYILEIPIVLFYKLDFSNVPVVLGGFAMGPLQGILVLLMKDLIGRSL